MTIKSIATFLKVSHIYVYMTVTIMVLLGIFELGVCSQVMIKTSIGDIRSLNSIENANNIDDNTNSTLLNGL